MKSLFRVLVVLVCSVALAAPPPLSAWLKWYKTPPVALIINPFVFSTTSNWWEAGGATGVVAAYRPKGAADYSASKVNLANPGTHDLTDGSAVTWSSGNGWEFNGSTYLVSDILPEGDWTALIQVNTISSGQLVLFGINAGDYFRIYADSVGSAYYGNGSQTPISPVFDSPGNIGFAGLTAVRDGANVGTITGSGYPGNVLGIYLGGENSVGSLANGSTFKCTAFVVYNRTLTSGEYAAVAAAMAGL